MTIIIIIQGNFNVPVAERICEQRNAVVRYWRQRDSLHLGPQSTPTLYFDGEKVVKKSSIASLVAKTFDQAKAGGCKKTAKSSRRWLRRSERKRYPTSDKQRSEVSHTQCQIHK